jgi:glycerophosphoryl diester phosphodiesterase
VLVLAHRGANRLAPENTVAAMRAALARGADGVELDVHRSADGELVVRHDADTPAGLLAELTVDELRRALPDVPTLAQVLDACTGALVNVEVKDTAPGAAAALVALLEPRDDRVVVSSFDWAQVDRVRAASPELRTGLLSFGVPPDEVLAAAVLRGHGAVHPDVWTLLGIDVPAFVGRAHREGVEVDVWTVNDASQAAMLRDAGVDAVITDDHELYAPPH